MGVFKADIAGPEWNVSSVLDYTLDALNQAPGSGSYSGLDSPVAISNLGSGLSLDAAGGVRCANMLYLTKRDGHGLKLKRDHAEIVGDIGKDLFVEKCKGQAEEARHHCHEHQSSTSCARSSKDMTFGRIFHKGKKYGCKKLKKREEGKVHCKRIKA